MYLLSLYIVLQMDSGDRIDAVLPQYDTSEKNIEYTNDFEYRGWLRKLFCMVTPEDMKTDLDIDEISRDEMDYDEEAASKYMDHILNSTVKHPLFADLYQCAAGLMFSVDRSVGLCVLLSYDYLPWFHRCLCCFFETPDEFNETHPDYVKLREKIV